MNEFIRHKNDRTLIEIVLTAISDLSVALTSGNIRTSSIVLLEPKMWGVAIEISSLSYIQAELFVDACQLLVNGSHL